MNQTFDVIIALGVFQRPHRKNGRVRIRNMSSSLLFFEPKTNPVVGNVGDSPSSLIVGTPWIYIFCNLLHINTAYSKFKYKIFIWIFCISDDVMGRMGAVDSGNETLPSDDSPVEPTSPARAGPGLPPRIQPYSGVLGNVSIILIFFFII